MGPAVSPTARHGATQAPKGRRSSCFAGRWGGMILAACIVLAACGSNAPEEADEGQGGFGSASLPEGQRLRVVATTSIVGDVVGRVGGDRIELTVLIGLGVDPHTYVATPADSAAVFDADLFVASGAGLEEGLPEFLEGADSPASVLSLSDEISLGAASEEEPEPASGSSGSPGRADPHVWFDVQNVAAWSQTIQDRLSALDPANASTYETNAAAYRRELDELDSWILSQVAAVPPERRRLLTSHETLGYFARRYEFVLVGAVYPLSPSSEPAAQELAALEETIRLQDVPVLFTEGTVRPVLADQIARDTGIRLVPLFTESLGAVGSGADSYIAMMRHNVLAIVSALR